MTVLRVRWTRHGKIRFLGHRDTARVWERALRRVGVPLAWSEGFSPRPRVSFGLALPTGAESDGEYLDLRLTDGVEVASGSVPGSGVADGRGLALDDLPGLLTDVLPTGMAATAVAAVPARGPSLQEAVVACSWWIELRGVDGAGAGSVVSSILSAPALPTTRERKGRITEVDLRPAVRAIEVDGPTEAGWALRVELDAQPRTVRPTDLLAALGGSRAISCGRWRRTHQWISRDGAPAEPLTAAPAPAPPVLVGGRRAS